MQTSTMERPAAKQALTETVTIKYVNDPKGQGKPGSIKDAGGQYYSVWNMALLAQFRAAVDAGNDTCFVDYTVNDNGFRTATAMRPVASRPAQQQRATAPATPQTNGRKMDQQNGSARYPTHPKDAEQIWTCAILKSLIERGFVRDDMEELRRATMNLRQVWKDTFGSDEPDNPLAAG